MIDGDDPGLSLSPGSLMSRERARNAELAREESLSIEIKCSEGLPL